jgi:hypothetical protein
MRPRARKDDLTVCELPDETLVYDRLQNKAHCLNAVAATVWRLCDGNRSLEELAQLAGGVEVVTLALEQLGRRYLLDEAPPPLPASERLGRRDALKQLVAVAVTLPLVLTVATKAAAQTMSDPATSSSTDTPAVVVQPTINVNIGGGGGGGSGPGRGQPTPPPCRTKGQSCIATASGQRGTCCPGLACNNVFQGAGVCG